MTQEKINALLGRVTYKDAIEHYRDLKDEFLRDYALSAQTTAFDAEKQFNQMVADEIRNNPIGNQQNLMQSILDEIQAALALKLEGTNPNELKNLRQKMRSIKTNKTKQGNVQLQKALNNILNEQEMYNIVMNKLRGSFATQGFDVNDILDQVRSYRDRAIVLINSKQKYFINSGKGFIREGLLNAALGKFVAHIDTWRAPVFHGAATAVNNKKSIYDLYIDFFNDAQKSQIITESLQFGGQGYGIQSKPWLVPWEVHNRSISYQRYSIGSRGTLLRKLESEKNGHYITWIETVYFLEKHMRQALGERQVLWGTGTNLIWTYQMIEWFRKTNYYLAFTYSKTGKKWSSTASWQNPPQQKS